MAATSYRTLTLSNITSTPTVTPAFDTTHFDDMSFQLCNDAGANVTGTLQVSNVPPQGDPARPGVARNDAVNSSDWTSPNTSVTQANIASTSAGASTIASITCQAYRAVRYQLTSTGTTTAARMYIFASGSGP